MTTRPLATACALGLALAVACTRAVVPEPRVDAGVDASVVALSGPADAAADAAPRPPEKAAAWTDDVIVRELVKDCAWAPKLPKEEEAIKDWLSDAKVSPLACDMHFAQSCAPDPCYGHVVIECGPGCAKACNGCGEGCAKKCTACKKDCTDEACKLACARTCGECHDECVKESDRCRTGKCVAESEACYKREYEKFTKLGCEKLCDAMSTCYWDCMNEPKGGPGLSNTTSQCIAKCGPKMGKCAKDYDYGCAVGWRPHAP